MDERLGNTKDLSVSFMVGETGVAQNASAEPGVASFSPVLADFVSPALEVPDFGNTTPPGENSVN